MESWGIFATKRELKRMIRRINRAGFDIFEVRPLTLVEKVTYVANDARLYLNEPHIIMFNTTKEKYNKFVRRYRLGIVF